MIIKKMIIDFQQLLTAYERLLDDFKKNNRGFLTGYEHDIALEEYFTEILEGAKTTEQSNQPNEACK